jgi:nucleoside-diphosphate-sugar epimerase
VSETLLLTGAQGFVGRWFAAASGFRRVVGIGRSARRASFTHEATLGPHRVTAPLPSALRSAPQTEYVSCDVRDEDALIALLRTERPHAIVHLAAALRDDPPSALFPANVDGTIALLHAVARSGVRVGRIVLGSSGSVYGAPQRLPVREDDGVNPPDLYAVSKLAAEWSARVLARELDLPLVVARIFNVVGPGLDERHACARFASQLAAAAHGYAERVVVGELTPTRDFADVRDVAAALAILARRGAAGTTYNVASGRETALREVFEILLELSGAGERLEVVRGYRRAADCPRVVADVSRLAELGYAPAHALSASLAALYGYYADDVARAVSAAVTNGAKRDALAADATHG